MVADLLQRGFAKYGDSTGWDFIDNCVVILHSNDSGTRTRKKTKSAEKNLELFYSTLGRLV